MLKYVRNNFQDNPITDFKVKRRWLDNYNALSKNTNRYRYSSSSRLYNVKIGALVHSHFINYKIKSDSSVSFNPKNFLFNAFLRYGKNEYEYHYNDSSKS